jgi:hypothetical protein
VFLARIQTYSKQDSLGLGAVVNLVKAIAVFLNLIGKSLILETMLCEI